MSDETLHELEARAVQTALRTIEQLAAALTEFTGDRRLTDWAAGVEMTAREFAAMPLAPRARRMPCQRTG